LALVEDESDVLATKELKAEVNANTAEFDENDTPMGGENDETNTQLVKRIQQNETNKMEDEFKSIETEVIYLILFCKKKQKKFKINLFVLN
jgi:hypothetical protein